MKNFFFSFLSLLLLLSNNFLNAASVKNKSAKTVQVESDFDEDDNVQADYEEVEQKVIVKKKKAPKDSLAINLDDIDNLDSFIKNNNLVMVVFCSETCHFCGNIDTVLLKVSKSNPEVKFVKADTVKFDSIRKKHRIEGVPTWVFFKGGKEVPGSRLNGGRKPKEVENAVKNTFYGMGYRVITSSVDPRTQPEKSVGENLSPEKLDSSVKSGKSGKSGKTVKNKCKN